MGSGGASSGYAPGCMQMGENWSALRTPAQRSGGAGARQRSGPTGGAANGMPLNTRTPSASLPSTKPDAVRIGSAAANGENSADTARMSPANRPLFIDIERLHAAMSFPCFGGALGDAETATGTLTRSTLGLKCRYVCRLMHRVHGPLRTEPSESAPW